MTGEKKITGQCTCGSIKFSISGEPVWAGYCHCAQCRRSTGSISVAHVGFHPSQIIFDSPAPQIYESSEGVKRGFCAKCGSSLTYESKKFEDYIQVYLGVLDNPEQINLKAHVHCEEKLSWFNIEDDLPRFIGSAAEEGNSWIE